MEKLAARLERARIDYHKAFKVHQKTYSYESKAALRAAEQEYNRVRNLMNRVRRAQATG